MKKLKEVGVKAFSVHGKIIRIFLKKARYYWQKGDKRGKADWDAIKKIRETFPDIPIIGNGNIGEYEGSKEGLYTLPIRLPKNDILLWSKCRNGRIWSISKTSRYCNFPCNFLVHFPCERSSCGTTNF